MADTKTSSLDSPLIVGIVGKMGVGKDFIGSALATTFREASFPAMMLALADPLKFCAMREDASIKSEDVFGPTKTAAVRQVLQQVGGRERERCGPDVWVQELLATIALHHRRDNALAFIVTDVRFVNEAKALKDAGALLILVNAPIRNATCLDREAAGDEAVRLRISSHCSETESDSPEMKELCEEKIDNDPGCLPPSNADAGLYVIAFKKLASQFPKDTGIAGDAVKQDVSPTIAVVSLSPSGFEF